MLMCIQNLVKFCPFILKIWSKNLILESIKGRNSVANLRKNNDLHTNVDLVNDDVYTKFGIFDFPRKRRCLYSALSFTHLLRLKQQWFSVVNTFRI